MARGRAAVRRAPSFIDPPGYARHRPEQTLLYRLVEQHYAAFVTAREVAGRPLPRYVQKEFEAYLKCGRLEHGFLRVKCEACHAEKLVAFSCKGRAICPSCAARRMAETAALLVDEVLPSRLMRQWVLSLPFALRFLLARDPEALTHVLGIVYRAIAGYILEKARLTHATGDTGAVTLIQRFGSALNANIHFHMLFLDGAYLTGTNPPVFRRIDAPSAKELQALVERMAERIGQALDRKGLLVRDCENSYLSFDPAAGGPMDDLIGHSIAYRVAMGPRAGQKAFTLQTVPAEPPEEQKKGVAQTAGFSLHAGIGIEADARAKLERLCRYISRPAVSEERLALTERGDVHCAAQDSLSRRYNARDPRAARFAGAAGGACAAAAPASDALPRRVRSAPRAAGRDHPGRPRSRGAAHRRRRAARAETRLADVGAAAETRVRDRDRDVPALRREAQGDREHRGPGADRAHSRAS
jgi:hypothetical protein